MDWWWEQKGKTLRSTNELVALRSRLGHSFDPAPTSVCKSLRGVATALDKRFRP